MSCSARRTGLWCCFPGGVEYAHRCRLSITQSYPGEIRGSRSEADGRQAESNAVTERLARRGPSRAHRRRGCERLPRRRRLDVRGGVSPIRRQVDRSEEHTSELQAPHVTSYAAL